MQALVGAWRTTSLVTSLTYVPKAYTPNVESISRSSAIYPDFPFQRLPGTTASWLEELIWSTRKPLGIPLETVDSATLKCVEVLTQKH